MTSKLRLSALVSVVATATLIMVGCASSPSDAGSEPAPGPAPAPSDGLEVEAAWLDGGRLVGVVTWGSSGCVPTAEEATAEGQTVSVTLDPGPADQACTADYAPRASLMALPEGVDPTQEVTLIVTLGDATGETELDGHASFSGVVGTPTDYAPSAGWFDDEALVLLTWGSSTCPPIVESVEPSAEGGTVTFVTEDRPCTMDVAPRLTMIGFGEGTGDDAFVLTLVGDNLDATLEVLAG